MSVALDRLVRNHIIFREVNDRICDVVERLPEAGLQPIEFVCECSHTDCFQTVVLELDEYKTIRSSSKVFVISSGHEMSEVENVIATNERFSLVERTRHIELVEDSHAPTIHQSG